METDEIEAKIKALEEEEMPEDAHADWAYDQQEYIDNLKEKLKATLELKQLAREYSFD